MEDGLGDGSKTDWVMDGRWHWMMDGDVDGGRGISWHWMLPALMLQCGRERVAVFTYA